MLGREPNGHQNWSFHGTVEVRSLRGERKSSTYCAVSKAVVIRHRRRRRLLFVPMQYR